MLLDMFHTVCQFVERASLAGNHLLQTTKALIAERLISRQIRKAVTMLICFVLNSIKTGLYTSDLLV